MKGYNNRKIRHLCWVIDWTLRTVDPHQDIQDPGFSNKLLQALLAQLFGTENN